MAVTPMARETEDGGLPQAGNAGGQLGLQCETLPLKAITLKNKQTNNLMTKKRRKGQEDRRVERMGKN